jgi:hypothetical protein
MLSLPNILTLSRILAVPMLVFLLWPGVKPESIQPLPDGSFMIGEEFGPFLVHISADGVVQRVAETRLEGQVLMTPDHPSLQVAPSPTAGVPYRVRRSGGYEGMALTPDGQEGIAAFLEKRPAQYR